MKESLDKKANEQKQIDLSLQSSEKESNQQSSANQEKNLNTNPVEVKKKTQSSDDPFLKRFRNTILVLTGVALTSAIFFSSFLPETNLKIPANQIMENIATGSKIAGNDADSALVPMDFTLELSKSSDGGDSRMLVWDFAAEDGDEVEIIVNGKPLGAPIVILNSPAVFSIPVPSVVQIRGIKDGGGGITYAVFFPGDKLAYFNVAPVGGFNTYTITVKP
ncbi:hypothetical protein [Leptospira alstonii]|uniref:Uncharacterized protein n=2 Tax=Leptospira alstonii TaxID=28452 RepID=M6CN56_9LEPT|nr:hypothetical protein [Leptospira alstonii]EMJ93174.1 hypothetical protein LEP1GSC194_1766 [Leptospira alstonii serovar Sichuan str. 79601]EQA78324.1 hypothetical protein LEP1GSC193_4112 [Leptospira alstonii serovar Pingchang str. 80-412]